MCYLTSALIKALISEDSSDAHNSPQSKDSQKLNASKNELIDKNNAENAIKYEKDKNPLISIDSSDNMIFHFQDPYVNLPTPTDNKNLKVESILDKLDNFMKKNNNVDIKNLKNTKCKSKGNLDLVAPTLHSGVEHHYSGIGRNLNDDNKKDIWRKSYELLDKINVERSNKLYKYRLDSSSCNSILSKDFIKDLSLYKMNVKYTYRSKSRQENDENLNNKQTKENSEVKQNSEPNVEDNIQKTRNAMNRNRTEVNILKPANEISRYVFNNRDVADEMFRLINPKSIQTNHLIS